MNRKFFYGFLTILILLFMSQTHAQDQPSEGEGAISCIDVFDDKDICNCLDLKCPHEVGEAPKPSCFEEEAIACGVDPKLLQGLN
ncbi:MAG TPA: hypothetical protein EYQ77_05180 [Methylococcaceae bacterium]|nr:hypothetical protein [Methylococcaceae bacterium]